MHNAHLKMLLENDEKRLRGCRMTATRQHLPRLLKYYPRQPCTPSLIKSRFFSHTTNLLTVLTFLHFEFLICIHAGNARVPPGFLPLVQNPAGAISSHITRCSEKNKETPISKSSHIERGFEIKKYLYTSHQPPF